MKLTENLKKARKEKGLTQESVAEMLGVTRQAVTKWETGASSPSTANLLALASLYAVPLEALMGQDESTLSVAPAKKRRWPLVTGLVCAAVLLAGLGTLGVVHSLAEMRVRSDYMQMLAGYYTQAPLLIAPSDPKDVKVKDLACYAYDVSSIQGDVQVLLDKVAVEKTMGVIFVYDDATQAWQPMQTKAVK